MSCVLPSFHDHPDKRKIEKPEIGVSQMEVMLFSSPLHQRNRQPFGQAGSLGDFTETLPLALITHDIVQRLYPDITFELRDILGIEKIPVYHGNPLVAPYIQHILRYIMGVIEIELHIDDF